MKIYLLIQMYLSCFIFVRSKWLSLYFFIINLLLISLFVGGRDKVGGDWDNYVRLYERVQDTSIILSEKDIGFSFLASFFSNAGFELVVFNLFSSFIFCVLIFLTFRKEVYVSRVLVILFPFVFVMLGMNVSRQFLAVGFVMFSFRLISNDKHTTFYLFIIIATLFHKSAIIFLVTPYLKNIWVFLKLKHIVMLLLILVTMLSIFKSQLEQWLIFYSDGDFGYGGYLFRMSLISLSIVIFYSFKNKIIDSNEELSLINALVICFVVFLVSGFFVPAAADRQLYYLYFIPCFVYLRIHRVFVFTEYKVIAVATCSIILFLYLNFWFVFGSHSYSWLDYKSGLVW